jgi:hypothetical protein
LLAAGAPAAAQPRSAAVIDLERGDRESRATRLAAARAALATRPGIEAISDPELDAALAGEIGAEAEDRGRAAAAEAERLATAGDCAGAGTAGRVAALDLAAALAAGADVTAELTRAHVALLLCAEAGNDPAAALVTAQTLRALGHTGPPPGIDAATWARYPELDATGNVQRAEVVIESEAPDAEIWVDYRRRGQAPVTLYLEQGEHVVAVAAGAAGAARHIAVTGWSHRETLSPAPAAGRWARVATLVAAVRERRQAADAAGIGAILAAAGIRFGVVLTAGGSIEVWEAQEGESAVLIGRRRDIGQAVGLAAQAARPLRAPDPGEPLLRETEAERRARQERDKSSSTRWWVYAAVVGAAALGAGIIILPTLGDSGSDRQRFEITLP